MEQQSINTNNTDILPEKVGVGTIFVSTRTNRILLNLRAPHKTHPMCWSLWGGMVETGEKPKEALIRELKEEMNFEPDIEKIYPFDVYQSRDKHFKYYSFVCVVREEFIPELNMESAGYAWVDLGQWPKPMHLGAKISFCNKKAEDRLRLIVNQHLV